MTSKKNLTDYYPVYMETNSSQVMMNAETLIEQAGKCGFNTFQTIVLLVKNTFEGHLFLNYGIHPEELYKEGTIVLTLKSELLLLNFYENVAQYLPGLSQSVMQMQLMHDEMDAKSVDALIYHVLFNNFIRFPVDLFSTYNISGLRDLPVPGPISNDKRFRLVLLAERFLGEYLLIKQVDAKYFEKFSELIQQLRLKEEVFSHYQRKLILAPFVNSDQDLDEMMYQKLVEEKLNSSTHHMENLRQFNKACAEASAVELQIREKMKLLYRGVSKNCAEVHNSIDADKIFPELNEIFLDVSAIYNEPLFGLAENFLNYTQMSLLLSKLLVFRKSAGLPIADGFQWLAKELLLSKNELKLLETNLDEMLINFRIKSFAEYKMRFVLDDELTEIHRHFLRQQMEYMDNKILDFQNDIKEILKMKSQGQKS